jgi:hypothetical protein
VNIENVRAEVRLVISKDIEGQIRHLLKVEPDQV